MQSNRHRKLHDRKLWFNGRGNAEKVPCLSTPVTRGSQVQRTSNKVKNTAKSITDVTYFVLNLEAVPREHCSRKHWATLQRQLQNTLEVHCRLAFLTHIQDRHFHSFIPMHFSLCHLSLMLFAPTFTPLGFYHYFLNFLLHAIARQEIENSCSYT